MSGHFIRENHICAVGVDWESNPKISPAIGTLWVCAHCYAMWQLADIAYDYTDGGMRRSATYYAWEEVAERGSGTIGIRKDVQ